MLRESTSGTNFDASVSLLRSDILSLKTMASVPGSWDTVIADRIKRAVRYASQAESSTGHAQEDLLDELDKVAHGLLRFFDVRDSDFSQNLSMLEFQTGHWANKIELNGLQDREQCPSFLHYAIQNNLALYVKAKLSRQFSLINSTGQPLLTFAIFTEPFDQSSWPSTLADPNEKWNWSSCSTRPSTLASILQAGADPNEKWNGTTPWRQVLIHLHRYSQNFKFSLSRDWVDVCRLLVLYGANPRAYLVNERLEHVSALQVVSSAFLHLPQASVEDLKILLIQRGALREPSHKMRRGKRKLEDSYFLHPQSSNDRLGYAPNRWDLPSPHRDMRAVSSSVATNLQDAKPVSALVWTPTRRDTEDTTSGTTTKRYKSSFIPQSQTRQQRVYHQPSTSQP